MRVHRAAAPMKLMRMRVHRAAASMKLLYIMTMMTATIIHCLDRWITTQTRTRRRNAFSRSRSPFPTFWFFADWIAWFPSVIILNMCLSLPECFPPLLSLLFSR
ncbi:hypothetical protein AMTRI_Chr11g156240 [Amborella trichopoda]